MRYYKYIIEQKDSKYYYYVEHHDTTPETEVFFSQFQFDKVVIIDIPSEDKQVFLFDNQLMLEAFKAGVYAEYNLAERFRIYEDKVVHADESEGRVL